MASRIGPALFLEDMPGAIPPSNEIAQDDSAHAARNDDLRSRRESKCRREPPQLPASTEPEASDVDPSGSKLIKETSAPVNGHNEHVMAPMSQSRDQRSPLPLNAADMQARCHEDEAHRLGGQRLVQSE